MEQEIKYPFRIGVEKLEFFNQDIHNEFADDFDEVYNIFLHELDQLMFKWGVSQIDAYVGLGVRLVKD